VDTQGRRVKVVAREELLHILQTSPLTVVDFWAPWCLPCHTVDLRLQRLQEAGMDFTVVKVNVEQAPTLARTYGVQSVPTLLRFVDQELTGRLDHLPTPEELRNWISGGGKNLGSATADR